MIKYPLLTLDLLYFLLLCQRYKNWFLWRNLSLLWLLGVHVIKSLSHFEARFVFKFFLEWFSDSRPCLIRTGKLFRIPYLWSLSANNYWRSWAVRNMGSIDSIIWLLGSIHRIIWLLGGARGGSGNISNRPLLDFLDAVLLGRVLFRYDTHCAWGDVINPWNLYIVLFFHRCWHLPVLIVGNLSVEILDYRMLSLVSLYWLKVGFFLFQIMSRHTILMLEKLFLSVSRGRLPLIIVRYFCNNHFSSGSSSRWTRTHRGHHGSWRCHFLRYLRWGHTRLVLIVWNRWCIITDRMLLESCYICSSGNRRWTHNDLACSQVGLCAIQSNQGHVRIMLDQDTRLLRDLYARLRIRW